MITIFRITGCLKSFKKYENQAMSEAVRNSVNVMTLNYYQEERHVLFSHHH